MTYRIADDTLAIKAAMKKLGLNRDEGAKPEPKEKASSSTEAGSTLMWPLNSPYQGALIRCLGCNDNIMVKDGRQDYRYACADCFNKASSEQREQWLTICNRAFDAQKSS